MWSLILSPGRYLEGEGSLFFFPLFLWCYFQQPDSASKPLTMSLLYTGVLFCSPDITCTAHPGVCSGLHNSCDHSRFGDSKLIWSADFESSHTLFYQHALPWPSPLHSQLGSLHAMSKLGTGTLPTSRLSSPSLLLQPQTRVRIKGNTADNSYPRS